VGVRNDKQRQDRSRSGKNNESAVGVQILRTDVPYVRIDRDTGCVIRTFIEMVVTVSQSCILVATICVPSPHPFVSGGTLRRREGVRWGL